MNTNSAAGDEPETIYTNPSGSGAKRTPAMTLCESIRHKLGDAEFVPGEEWRFEISSREGPGTAVVRLVVEKNARAAVERTPEKRAYTGYRGYTPCLGLVEAAPLSRLLWEFYAPGFRLSAGTDKYETDEEFHEAFYRSFMERESKLGDCLTVTEMATALDGQPLPPDRQAHVDGCPKCTTELKELKASCPKDDPCLKEEEECEYELDDGGGVVVVKHGEMRDPIPVPPPAPAPAPVAPTVPVRPLLPVARVAPEDERTFAPPRIMPPPARAATQRITEIAEYSPQAPTVPLRLNRVTPGRAHATPRRPVTRPIHQPRENPRNKAQALMKWTLIAAAASVAVLAGIAVVNHEREKNGVNPSSYAKTSPTTPTPAMAMEAAMNASRAGTGTEKPETSGTPQENIAVKTTGQPKGPGDECRVPLANVDSGDQNEKEGAVTGAPSFPADCRGSLPQGLVKVMNQLLPGHRDGKKTPDPVSAVAGTPSDSPGDTKRKPQTKPEREKKAVAANNAPDKSRKERGVVMTMTREGAVRPDVVRDAAYSGASAGRIDAIAAELTRMENSIGPDGIWLTTGHEFEVRDTNSDTERPSQKPEGEVKASALPPRTHVVKKGDTLSKIAALYGVSQEDIQKLNGLANPDHIVRNQPLLIPEKKKK